MTKTKYNKHQKLPTQEANWKWEYLINKYNNSENITAYNELDLVKTKTEQFLLYKNDPERIEQWIKHHLNPLFIKKLNQAIRRKRKRYFDNEKIYSSKKMVELEYEAWNLLSIISRAKNVSLSQAVIDLVENLDPKQLQIYQQQVKEKELNDSATTSLNDKTFN